ncbi:hypothetical protein HDU86_002823 [Geranomyces michiganensis]|nr:hypothetical protein HDU86_002823 [Geranomyces michiganensis]
MTQTLPPTPIAVVGYGFRMPSGVTNPSKLWDLLKSGTSAQTEIPADRFSVEGHYHPHPHHRATSNVRHGHFLQEDLSLFDAGFFNINKLEAEGMDPQQRLLLEVVYEALENGGMPLEKVKGSNTGVWAGAFTNDYHELLTRDRDAAPKYQVTGSQFSMISNRVSFTFDLHGPSLTVDTACSSSLVAAHLACQSLHLKESDMAIVCGTSLHYAPEVYDVMSNLNFLSPTGLCHTFDREADGYSRGEGIVAVILKPLDAALRDGDNIRSIIKTSATNQDGHTSAGITCPSAEAQEIMIRKAYETAGLSIADTQYFEAHGTGTPTGDPLETSAIGKVLMSEDATKTLYVGSIKTNIGHLEGASGLAGLIKVSLAMEQGYIPPNVHFREVNPNIKLRDWHLRVPTSLVPWPQTRDAAPRRASVNSFGYGGSNAHVIVEGYTPARGQSLISASQPRPFLYPLTVDSNKSTLETLKRWSQFCASDQGQAVNIGNLAYTLSTRRSRLRLACTTVASSINELGQRWQAEGVEWMTRIDSTEPIRVGFVFTGQGAQWIRMGAQLILSSFTFRQSLKECDDALTRLTDGPAWSITGR